MDLSTSELTRLQLLELDICASCANCAEFCPTYTERKEPELIPGGRSNLLSEISEKERGLLSRILGFRPLSKSKTEKITNTLFHCSLCGRCQYICPFSIQTHQLWESFREIAFKADLIPDSLRMLIDSIKVNGNPYGADSEMRSLWIEYSGLENAPINKRAKTVYFVGCTSALKSQTQDIPYHISRILNEAKEQWTLLGDEELCCGAPSLMAGDLGNAKILADHNVKILENLGAESVVTNCPSCFRMLKQKYPLLLGKKLGFRVVHAVQLAHEYLWKSGKLLITEKTNERIAYHDPCELARLCNIIEEPREVLQTLTKNLIELPESRLDVRCCGGGGLLQATDNAMRLKIAQKRIAQAEKLGIDTLVSACPACKITLQEGGINSNSKMKVLDVMEFLAEKLNLPDY